MGTWLAKSVVGIFGLRTALSSLVQPRFTLTQKLQMPQEVDQRNDVLTGIAADPFKPFPSFCQGQSADGLAFLPRATRVFELTPDRSQGVRSQHCPLKGISSPSCRITLFADYFRPQET